MLQRTDYKTLLEDFTGVEVKNVFGNYFLSKNGECFYNFRPLKTNWRESRSGEIYLTYRLWNKDLKKTETHYVHRLMAVCFLGDITDLTIDHIDNNPQNNKISNLEIVTMFENSKRKRERMKKELEDSQEIQIILRKNLKIVRFKKETKT